MASKFWARANVETANTQTAIPTTRMRMSVSSKPVGMRKALQYERATIVEDLGYVKHKNRRLAPLLGTGGGRHCVSACPCAIHHRCLLWAQRGPQPLRFPPLEQTPSDGVIKFQ